MNQDSSQETTKHHCDSVEGNIAIRFIRGASFNTAGEIIRNIFNFFSLIIVVRTIPKEQFGTFMLLSVIAYFFAEISDCGMGNTAIRFVAAEKNKQRQIIATALGIRLVISLIIFLLILTLSSVICRIFDSTVLGNLTFFISVMFFLQYLSGSLQSFLIGLHLYRRLAIVQVVDGAARGILILLFILLLKWQLMGLLFAVILSSMLASILAYSFLPWFVLPKINSNILKRMFCFGFPLQVSNILAFTYYKINILMLGAMLNPLSVAIYEVGNKIPDGLGTIFNGFRQVYLSYMSDFYGNNKKENTQKLLNTSLRLVSFILAFCTLFVGLFHRKIVIILFSQKYIESGIILFILMTGVAIGKCNHLMENTLIASGNPKKILIPNITQSILNVVGNLVLIRLWGVIGAAGAFLISASIVNPVFLLLFEKKYRLSIAWSYFRSFIALGLSLSIFYFLGWDNLSFKIFIIAIFLLINLNLGVVSKREIFLCYNELLAKNFTN